MGEVFSQGYPLWMGWYLKDGEDLTFGAALVVGWRDADVIRPILVGLPADEGYVLMQDCFSTSNAGAEERVKTRYRRNAIRAARQR